MMAIHVDMPVSLERGALYDFKGLRGRPTEDGTPTWAFPPGRYRYLGLARDYRSSQERVVYVGVEGHDKGVWHVAGLADWIRDFTKVETEPSI